MSLILDALRKSERVRQTTLAGQLSHGTDTPPRTRTPAPWALLIGVILLLNALVLAWLFWRVQRPTAAPAMASAPEQAAIPVANHPVIRSLAAEAGDEVTSVTPATSQYTTPTAEPVPVVTATQSSQHVQTETPHTTPSAPESTPDAPVLDTLPQNFQQSLPKLHLDVHGYATDPAQRFVVINMQRYVTGDVLKEGPRVIAIVPDGVVLEYHGTRFLLPRN